MSYAYCCESCNANDPHWVIERHGDAVVTWACDKHLPGICASLQRHREITVLSVKDYRKVSQYAGGPGEE
jgi:hypothetical protein